MRHIIKRPREPKELVSYREAKKGISYDDFTEKDALREPLVEDQGGLCCYCMCRIEPDEKHMKIEHYRSQARHPDLQLKWSNLLAACRGGERKPPQFQTCDTRRRDDDLTIDPQEDRDVHKLKYLPDGRIAYGGPDEARGRTIQEDLDRRLNLNCRVLKENRKAALEDVKNDLVRELGSGSWSPSKIERKLGVLREQRPLCPFLGAIEYWLEKKIRQR
jgi:uncharacterized protein (TIGR02646 family)